MTKPTCEFLKPWLDFKSTVVSLQVLRLIDKELQITIGDHEVNTLCRDYEVDWLGQEEVEVLAISVELILPE